MSIISLTEDTDNVNTKIVKEDKNNTDILTITVPSTTTIGIGDTVNYNDKTSTLIFSGIVQTIKTGGGEKEVIVYDQGAQLLQRTVNQVFKSTSPEGIIQSVLTNFTDLVYVSTISSGITIETYVANKKRAWDVVTEMSELLLANFRVDKNSNFQLELEGDDTSSKTLTTNNASLDGKWNEDTTQLVNSISVDGDDRQIFERDPVFFSGTGAEVTYNLSEIPVDIKIENPAGTVKTGFVQGSTTGDYTLDRENKQFTGTFTSGTNNIKVTVTTSIPIGVRRRNKTSIDSFGQHDKTVKKPYLKTRSEASDLANFIIQRFSNPLLSSTWIVSSATDYNAFESYIPNEVISVTDTINNISGNFIIRKIERVFPGQLKIMVGEPEQDFVNWSKEAQQRVKQLEEKDDNSTILNEDEFIEENLTIQFDNDITDIKKRVFDSDTFYLADTSITRNQMKDDGSGPIMRNITDGNGFTVIDLDNDTRVTENGTDVRVTENGTDNRLTEGGTDGGLDVGFITTTFQNTAKDGFLTILNSTITHIAVGDDVTAPLVTNTTLGNETLREALFTPAVQTANDITFEIFLDTTENNGNDIKETGTFDALSGGNMYNRSLTNIITKDNTTEVTLSIKFSIISEVTNIV